MIKYLILALCLSLCGCASLDLSKLQGLTVGTAEWTENYPAFGMDLKAQGVVTNSISGITTVNSASFNGHNPFGGGSIAFTGLELDPKKPAPSLTTAPAVAPAK